jgi:hypothetical protein
MYYIPEIDTTYVMFTNVWNLQNGLDSLMSEIKVMTEIAAKILKPLSTPEVPDGKTVK